MNQILEEISNIGVVPVVAIDHKDDAAPLADALTKGVHTHHGRSVPGYAARCRYRINDGTG